jgi:hypothetical protein
MCAGEIGRLMLRIERAYRNHPVRRGILRLIEHRAMMLAVAAATGWQAGVGILREREQGRNQRERKGREEQDGEQASHGIRTIPVYASRLAGASAGLCCRDSVEYGRVVV